MRRLSPQEILYIRLLDRCKCEKCQNRIKEIKEQSEARIKQVKEGNMVDIRNAKNRTEGFNTR